MSLVLKFVRPSGIQNWIAANASGSLKRTALESWRAYLAANSGTGQTIGEQERSFLSAAGFTGKTLFDAWSANTTVVAASGSTLKEKLRNLYK